MAAFWTYLSPIALLMATSCLSAGTTGCMTIDPMGQIDRALSNPAIQSTLDEWAARGSLHNPRVGGQLVTGFEIYCVGVDVEGEISGDVRSQGIDPVLLGKLVEIAKERGYVPPPPTTQPAVIAK